MYDFFSHKNSPAVRTAAFILSFIFTFTSVAPAQAKNYQTWEAYHASTQAPAGEVDYSEIGDIGEACVDSFIKYPAYASLANQLYIFTPHEHDNSKEDLNWSIRSSQLQKEISSQSVDWTDLYWLRSESTQIYINQLIFNWRLQSEIFRNKADVDLGEYANDPEVQKAVSVAIDARKKITEIPNSWNEKELIDQAKSFNSMIDEINGICESSNILYKNLMIAYNDSQWQNLETNEWLANVLDIENSGTIVDGGVKGHIRKRIDELRGITSWEAAIYNGVMSQTMFGKMYSTKSSLRNHVGTFNTKGCVEYGSKLKKLPETKDALWKLLGNSYASVENEFKKNLGEVLQNAKEKDTKELLEDYIQSNPASIQLALWAKPSRERAKSACRVVQNLHATNAIKDTVAQMLSPIAMLATFMTAGAASGVTGSIIAYSALVLNTYFIGSTIVDLSVSRDLENRIQGALLAGQIDAATGQDMISQLQASRPFSYLNITLSGLGAAAAVSRLARMAKIARYKDYINAQGGATPKKFAAAKEAYFGKQIKSNAFTKEKINKIATKIKSPEPQGVKHDLGSARIKEILKSKNNPAPDNSNGLPYGESELYGYIKPPKPPKGSSGGYGEVAVQEKVATQTAKPSVTSSSVKPVEQPVARAATTLESATKSKTAEKIHTLPGISFEETISQPETLTTIEKMKPKISFPTRPDIVPYIGDLPFDPILRRIHSNKSRKAYEHSRTKIMSREQRAIRMVMGLELFHPDYYEDVKALLLNPMYANLASELLAKIPSELIASFQTISASIMKGEPKKLALFDSEIEKAKRFVDKIEPLDIKDLPTFFYLTAPASPLEQSYKEQLRGILGIEITKNGLPRFTNKALKDDYLGTLVPKEADQGMVSKFKDTYLSYIRLIQTYIDIEVLLEFKKKPNNRKDVEDYIGQNLSDQKWIDIQHNQFYDPISYERAFFNIGIQLNWSPSIVFFENWSDENKQKAIMSSIIKESKERDLYKKATATFSSSLNEKQQQALFKITDILNAEGENHKELIGVIFMARELTSNSRISIQNTYLMTLAFAQYLREKYPFLAIDQPEALLEDLVDAGMGSFRFRPDISDSLRDEMMGSGGSGKDGINERASIIHLYSNGKKVKDYNNLILDAKAGDKLDFGDGKLFAVSHVINSFTGFFMIQLEDGSVLRAPSATISKENFSKFYGKLIEFKVLGIPVLDVEYFPMHAKYAIHEKIMDPDGFLNLNYYQGHKVIPSYESRWKSIMPKVDEAIVKWAKSTSKVEKIGNFSLHQIFYSYNPEKNVHEWKMVVIGNEQIDKYDGSNDGFVFNQEAIKFVDGTDLLTNMKEAVHKERKIPHESTTLPIVENANPTIHWLIDTLPGFKDYYENTVSIADKSLDLNAQYYLTMFSSILKSNPSLQSQWNRNFTHFQIEKIIKQVVDETTPDLRDEILANYGEEYVRERAMWANVELRKIFNEYSEITVLNIPSFILEARHEGMYEFENPFFHMKILSNDGNNHLIYNEEVRRDEMDGVNYLVDSITGSNNPSLEIGSKTFAFSDEDIRNSSNEKFLLIRGKSGKEQAYFLFVRDEVTNLYAPYGKVDHYALDLLSRTERQLHLLSGIQKEINSSRDPQSLKLQNYGKLEKIPDDVKNVFKNQVNAKNSTERFYFVDSNILPQVEWHKISVGSEVQYDLLYASRSQIFPTYKQSCVVVVDSKYYMPSLDPTHHFVFNKNGYIVTDIKDIDGMKYLFIQDKKEAKRETNTVVAGAITSGKPVVSVETRNLAIQAQNAVSAKEVMNTKSEMESSATPQRYLKDKSTSNVEVIAARHYFDEQLTDTQKEEWVKVKDDLILQSKYKNISLDEVLLILNRAHQTGNTKPKEGHSLSEEKIAALQTAKKQLVTLGYSEDDAFMIVSRLSDPTVMILGAQRPGEYEIPSYGSLPYGDTKFLDHLKFHLEETNDERKNNLDVLFHGIQTFYKNSGVDQSELQTFTTWLVKNFNFIPFWGTTTQGIDWGYSVLQWWNKKTGVQYDVSFLVNEKNIPYIMIRIPSKNLEVLYDFHFFVANLNKALSNDQLTRFYGHARQNYFYLTTHEKENVKTATTWVKDEFELESEEHIHELDPHVQSVAAQMPSVSQHTIDAAPIEHVVYHEEKPVKTTVKNLGMDGPSANQLIQTIESDKITLNKLKSLESTKYGSKKSTKLLKLSDGSEYFVKFFDPNNYRTAPDKRETEFMTKKLSELEYAIYLLGEKLTGHYVDSYLLDIEGQKVFFSKRNKEISFDFTDKKELLHEKISLEELMHQYYDLDIIQHQPVDYAFPEKIILFDFLIGYTDRALTENVSLVGNETFAYNMKNPPIYLPLKNIDIQIYDGESAFAIEPHDLIEQKNNFKNWYEKYFANPIGNIEYPEQIIKGLIVRNPDFIQILKDWSPGQISYDLYYLSKEHMDQFLRNRQFILDLALESGVLPDPSASRP